MPKLETCILGQSQLLAGSKASLRVIALNHVTGKPVSGVYVKAYMKALSQQERDVDAESLLLFSGRTNRDGTLAASFKAPDVQDGSYELTVIAQGIGERDTLTRNVRVVRDQQILLTTDKPLYQPGQVMHIRALALKRPSRQAVAKTPLTIEVEDGKGNKVFKKTQPTSQYGVASADFQLATEVNMGRYAVRALIGKTKAEKKVTVERYVLPKFKIKFTPDKSYYLPNETVAGKVQADYFFGKPVADGKVNIKASTFDFQFKDFAEISGRTDGSGNFKFEQKLPDYFVGQPLEQGNAFVKFEVAVKDGADHEEKITQTVPVAAQALKIIAVPDGGRIIPNVQNVIYVMTTYPDGSAASARVTVEREERPALRVGSLRTDATGIAEFRVTPPKDVLNLHITATDRNRRRAEYKIALRGSALEDAVLLRTDRALAKVGDVVNLTCLSPSPTGTIYIDVIRSGQTLHTASLDLVKGRGELSLPLSQDMSGSLEIHAYRISKSGLIVRDTRRLYVDPADDLRVRITPDKKSYLPGKPAKIAFDVRSSAGKGVSAALGVAIVDESVFALQEMQPGMEKIYFLLEKELMEPKFEVHGLSPANIVSPGIDETFGAEKQRAARVLFALAEQGRRQDAGAAYTLAGNSYSEKIRNMREQLSKRVRRDYAKVARAVVEYYQKYKSPSLKDRGGIKYLVEVGLLRRSDLLDRWGRPYDFTPCGCGSFEHSMTITSLGPDGRKGTEDDVAVGGSPGEPERARLLLEGGADLFMAKGVPAPPGPVGVDAALVAGPQAPSVRGVEEVERVPVAVAEVEFRGGYGGAAPAREEIRIRQFFPETMYFNPAVITDGSGKASIHVDVADSITTWRISAMASSAAGELGSTSQGLKCFQDFFIDTDLPVSLTQNDEVSIPVAVYNYLTSAQRVILELTTEPWFELLDSATKRLQIGENDVEAVYFRLRVKEIGSHRLTVHAMGTKMSDAISREIEVMPDGKEYQASINDRLEKTVENTLTIPEDAIDGASNILVKVYPGIFSQVVEGMDKILQMPFGCFEQTSSATYPNILVLDYMKSVNQITPEVQMKAEQYINLGYQRLVTFEVPGGGFSWFGDPPANKVLTAYGVMEFADMSKVYEVDPNLIQRTQQWLVAQREKDGSWSPDQNYLHEESWGRIQKSNLLPTAWIAWALMHSGYDPAEMRPSLSYLKENANDAKDAYTLAMLANALVSAGKDDPAALTALERLVDMKVEEDGKVSWKSDVSTITFTRGKSADVETTALAALAFIRSGRYPDVVSKALTFIIQAKDPNGTWGSTQATILSLKALLASMENRTQEINAKVTVLVNGQEAGTFKITPEDSDVLRQVDCKQFVREGENKIRVEFEGRGSSLYQIAGKYYLPWDKLSQQPEQRLISINVDFDRTTLAKDDIVTSTVKIAYNGSGTANMVMVDLGTPPGFQVMAEDLEALVGGKVVQRYTITSRQVILYFEKLEGGKPVEFKYRLKAKFPIRARTPKSTAYLYYNPEINDVAPPVNMVVE
ncbi:MAG TPA: alpha-2-macroglobulin family protein [Armatimonadota bacterium]|nr:alpha-2-macroglobulin family protein [Armatimonadota bacterium]